MFSRSLHEPVGIEESSTGLGCAAADGLASLAGDEDAFESPAWHEEELKKTEADYAAGRIEALDWEDAKKELRKRFEK